MWRLSRIRARVRVRVVMEVSLSFSTLSLSLSLILHSYRVGRVRGDGLVGGQSMSDLPPLRSGQPDILWPPPPLSSLTHTHTRPTDATIESESYTIIGWMEQQMSCKKFTPYSLVLEVLKNVLGFQDYARLQCTTIKKTTTTQYVFKNAHGKKWNYFEMVKGTLYL